ncbi:hypothetical protein B0T26DRAFT_681725 [Lasiosphaeria miniovina]|uniref:Uncharacterized protein n=1 Tax=Lasiosphaeria miniovina TaxID=1954250 RepID=A0AA39ZQ19_9PEZI|nr:uncharacterized protein B0T26DRAFT_681725 [Lasiosphaeria miniovina]KAK0701594.1 hypothetical protein B0T26DRAFT_681725 [Lasiosphaeria miniovina]
MDQKPGIIRLATEPEACAHYTMRAEGMAGLTQISAMEDLTLCTLRASGSMLESFQIIKHLFAGQSKPGEQAPDTYIDLPELPNGVQWPDDENCDIFQGQFRIAAPGGMTALVQRMFHTNMELVSEQSAYNVTREAREQLERKSDAILAKIKSTIYS